MNEFDGNQIQQYAQTALGGAGCSPTRMPSLQQRLDLAVKQAEDRLAKVREARDILSRNPDLEKLLDIMQQSHF